MTEGLVQNEPSPGTIKILRDKLKTLSTGLLIPPTHKDLAMISFMVAEAFQGVDIASRYPTFYEKLQTNHKLREHFLDALDLMEHTKAGTLAPLPMPPRRDLSFLQKAKAKPIVVQSSWEQWRITWKHTANQMQHFATALELDYRGEDEWYEKVWVPLLRDTVQVNNLKLQVTLEATPDEKDILYYSPVVTVIPSEDTTPLSTIQATLNWGDYVESRRLDARGRAFFPRIPLATFYNSKQECFTAELQLDLELIPATVS
jgi:hypothetical protein